MWNIEKADNIPMVMETNKTLGLRLLNASAILLFIMLKFPGYLVLSQKFKIVLTEIWVNKA